MKIFYFENVISIIPDLIRVFFDNEMSNLIDLSCNEKPSEITAHQLRKLRRAFKKVDKSNAYLITKEELSKLLQDQGLDDNLICNAREYDGKVDFKEFHNDLFS